MNLSPRKTAAVVAALALSLLLNFAWLGFVASRSMQPKRAEMSAERLVSINPNSLPPEIRKEVAAALEPKKDQVREAMRQVRDARRQVLQAMRADPVDPAALDSAFGELRRRLDDLSAYGEAAIAQGLQAAAPQARAEITPPAER